MQAELPFPVALPRAKITEFHSADEAVLGAWSRAHFAEHNELPGRIAVYPLFLVFPEEMLLPTMCSLLWLCFCQLVELLALNGIAQNFISPLNQCKPLRIAACVIRITLILTHNA